MNRPEDNILHWEQLGWENYGRWKQVREIFDHYFQASIGDFSNFSVTLNRVARAGLPLQASIDDPVVGELVEAVKTGVRINQTGSVLHEIETYIFNGGNGTKEISLEVLNPLMLAGGQLDGDKLNITGTIGLESLLIEVFPQASFFLGRAITEAKAGSKTEILAVLQGDIPLMPFRRDLLGQPDSRTISKGEIFYFPTRVAGITAKMAYENGDRLPAVSLVINPLGG